MYVFTDGSYDPKSKTGVGCFVILTENQFLEIASYFQKHGRLIKSELPFETKEFVATTPARLELETLLWALESELMQRTKGEKEKIRVVTDSKTIEGLASRRKKLEASSFVSTRKRVEISNADLYRLFYLQSDSLILDVVWVKGHGEINDPLRAVFSEMDKMARKKLRQSRRTIGQ